MQERIAESFGEAKTEWLAGLYSAAYRSSDLTPSEVWEEVVCDSLGDMNIFHDIPVMEEHAQELLDGISYKDAEWHYYESVVFYKKNWMNESKNQLELALKMDPENEKYKKSYEQLKAKMNFSEKQFHSGNYNANNNGADGSQKQMGGDTCMDMCATYCCMELMCRSCCR